MYYKEIICLANSRKLGNRCIAGKDVKTHKWIRPVSSRDTGELRLFQIRYDNREIPKILDIIKIPFNQEKSEFCQPENELISMGKWAKLGIYPKNELDILCDETPTLWKNFSYYNDKIAEDYIKKHGVKSSLLLIKPESAELMRMDRHEMGSITKKSKSNIFLQQRKIFSCCDRSNN